MPHVAIIGTCDTKLHELLWLRSEILAISQDQCKVTLVDVGRTRTSHEHINVGQDVITSKYAPKGHEQDVSKLSRGEVIKYMIKCASNWLREAHQRGQQYPSEALHGVVSAGGTGGTSLISGVMREALPIGFPKLIVSTAASGDTGPIVEEMDVTLMYSVVDIAGTNSLLKRVLSNAAGAIVGMSQACERSMKEASEAERDDSKQQKKKLVGLTMFGVTTPCVDRVRQYLEENHPIECFVFHCTGHGGKAMERLVSEGVLDAVLDITTTEICDQLMGGVMDAGPHRLEAALKAGIPNIISVGATDMVNFGPKSTVPERYQNRKLHEHNPTVTLMRTSPEECATIGQFIVDKVKKFARVRGFVEVVLPKGGVSMIAVPDGPFYDPQADEALFATIEKGLAGSGIALSSVDSAINDEAFAVDVAKRLVTMMGLNE